MKTFYIDLAFLRYFEFFLHGMLCIADCTDTAHIGMVCSKLRAFRTCDIVTVVGQFQSRRSDTVVAQRQCSSVDGRCLLSGPAHSLSSHTHFVQSEPWSVGCLLIFFIHLF